MEERPVQNSINPDRARVLLPPPVPFLAVLGAGIALHFTWLPWGLFPTSLIGYAAGSPLLLSGTLLIIWAVRTFLTGGENPDVYKPTKAIMQSGPYRISRNPMYLAMVLTYLGIGFLLNTTWPLIFLALPILVIHFGVILREEQYLEAMFGQQYQAYRSRVRRWL